ALQREVRGEALQSLRWSALHARRANSSVAKARRRHAAAVHGAADVSLVRRARRLDLFALPASRHAQRRERRRSVASSRDAAGQRLEPLADSSTLRAMSGANAMRRFHLAVGLFTLLAFLASGAYMKLVVHPQQLPDGEHLMFLSRHIYVLANALVNL